MSECRLGGDNLSIKDMGHPITENMKKDDIVKNDIEMSKNLIITGPNASGKTTILKGILLNVILSHQHGIGFYKEGSVIPIYVDIHCYLNIPDTSGRDSLFQAEARRCKEIIDNIENTHDEEENDTDDGFHRKTNSRHFCIFDELFSGTNPDEAISSSYGFIKYLLHTKRIDFALTTHLNSLCEKMEKENVKLIRNVMMETYDGSLDSNTEEEEEGEEEEEDGEEEEADGAKCQNEYCDFNYTYKMVEGVSKVKGGLKVLKDLKYPSSILRLF
jgi:DNA mismatch repair protein MutS